MFRIGDWPDYLNYPSQKDDYELIDIQNLAVTQMSENFSRLSNKFQASPITPVNFNPGRITINYLAHWPRFHPSDSRVKSLDGVARTG